MRAGQGERTTGHGDEERAEIDNVLGVGQVCEREKTHVGKRFLLCVDECADVLQPEAINFDEAENITAQRTRCVCATERCPPFSLSL